LMLDIQTHGDMVRRGLTAIADTAAETISFWETTLGER